MYLKAFFYVCAFLVFNLNVAAKTYSKNYYQSGVLKSEGWIENGNKNGYWKYYYANGQISEQGQYSQGKKVAFWICYNESGKLKQQGKYIAGEKYNWWSFYDSQGKIKHKCQLNDGIKNGYCLKYTNQKLSSAEKYKDGKKIKEWFSFSSFRSENNLTDLK